MVTATETGASPSRAHPRSGKDVFNKVAYIVGLGCCMSQRKPSPSTTTTQRSPLADIKPGSVNWSTSTLGIEKDLTLRSQVIRSDSSMPDTTEIPLSSFEFYPPTPASPPPVARPQSRPSRVRQRGTESAVITITDHDIATGTTPTIGECQREREERRHRRQRRNRDGGDVSNIQAWSQIDPLFGMYQQERERRMQRSSADQGRSPYSEIRAFDFLSYGGWIVM